MNNIVPYWNEDHTKYAVLVSVGFGAGFSSWSSRELAYDSRVVEFWLAHKDNEEWMRSVNDSSPFSNRESAEHKEAREFFASIGYDYVCMGGFADVELEWVPAGAKWRINEYDGAESLEIEKNVDWVYFN